MFGNVYDIKKISLKLHEKYANSKEKNQSFSEEGSSVEVTPFPIPHLHRGLRTP